MVVQPYALKKQFRPDHFSIRELVPPSIYKRRKQKAWQLMDVGILMDYDQIRKDHGRIICNTWHSEKLQRVLKKWCEANGFDHWDVVRYYSGRRTMEYYGSWDEYDASFSQHKDGKAIDGIPLDTPVQTVRQAIIDNPERYPNITFLEMGVPWLHGDGRNCNQLMKYRPPKR